MCGVHVTDCEQTHLYMSDHVIELVVLLTGFITTGVTDMILSLVLRVTRL